MMKNDKSEIINRYTERYKEFGYNPKSLGWDKGKQEIRFDILTSNYDFSEKTVLDLGCGFGDLSEYIGRRFNNANYIGIDIVPVLIEEANERFGNSTRKFLLHDVMGYNPEEKIDYVIASGIFNNKLHSNNYTFIEKSINKYFRLVIEGLALNFLSDKVDYKKEMNFYANPGKVLSIAYKYSRNIIIRNDYMPFEFSLFIFKDDSFMKEDTVFTRYKSIIKNSNQVQNNH
jgi:SAM-dependent methyltransferase